MDTFVATVGAVSPTICSAPQYQPDPGQSECIAAPPGSFVDSSQATTEICLFSSGATHLTVDVVGQVDGSRGYEPIEPSRLVETRSTGVTIDGKQQRIGRRAAGSTTVVEVRGRAGVGSDAGSVVANLTAIRPDSGGYITVWDCASDPPLASSGVISSRAGRTCHGTQASRAAAA